MQVTVRECIVCRASVTHLQGLALVGLLATCVFSDKKKGDFINFEI